MEFREITQGKAHYMELLLLADEQESMIYRYLEQGDMYVLFAPEAVGVCVVLDLGDGIFEIKNLAIATPWQKKGYGRAMMEFILQRYAGGKEMLVGTGESPLTLPFYKKCGFQEHHRVENFFIEHYDHPIFEGGVQLVDMIYLSRKL
jgi:GNAT superfamily N-acetyltransferase